MRVEEVATTADLPAEGQVCYVRETRHYWLWDLEQRIWQDLGTNPGIQLARVMARRRDKRG